MMTSAAPSWLILFASAPVNVPACQIFVVIGLIQTETSILRAILTFFLPSHTLEKAELTASIRRITRFLKSGIPIYNSEVPDTVGRKTRKRRIRPQAFAKCFAFYANAVKSKTTIVLVHYLT